MIDKSEVRVVLSAFIAIMLGLVMIILAGLSMRSTENKLASCQQDNVVLQAFMDGEFDDALPTQQEIDSWKY